MMNETKLDVYWLKAAPFGTHLFSKFAFLLKQINENLNVRPKYTFLGIKI
jgi:hypothetical protein